MIRSAGEAGGGGTEIGLNRIHGPVGHSLPVDADADPVGRVAVVSSFGYLHGNPPKADIVVDVRDHLRDPHVSPALRQMTGHDWPVMEQVLATPGAEGLIGSLVAAAVALLPGADKAGRLVQVAIGCAGGRHRSVVIADAVAARLALAGWATEAEHLHISEPVVSR